jgi:hypothetical protein
MLFSASVQPSIISLFSSTGSDPLTLFRITTLRLFPSFPTHPSLHQVLFYIFQKSRNRTIPQTMGTNLIERCYIFSHLQTTYIQCPKVESRDYVQCFGSQTSMDASPGSQSRKGMGFRSWYCGSCGTGGNRPVVYFSDELFFFPYPNHRSRRICCGICWMFQRCPEFDIEHWSC